MFSWARNETKWSAKTSNKNQFHGLHRAYTQTLNNFFIFYTRLYLETHNVASCLTTIAYCEIRKYAACLSTLHNPKIYQFNFFLNKVTLPHFKVYHQNVIFRLLEIIHQDFYTYDYKIIKSSQPVIRFCENKFEIWVHYHNSYCFARKFHQWFYL